MIVIIFYSITNFRVEKEKKKFPLSVVVKLIDLHPKITIVILFYQNFTNTGIITQAHVMKILFD